MYKILANTIFLGKDVHFLPECHSTNDIGLHLVRRKLAKEGSIVVCDHQSKGKGQRGNVWQSEPCQNLTFSLILRPDFMDLSEQFYLNMAISNSIRRLLQEYVPGLEVKWPNDLIVSGSGKVGGILIENTFAGKEWEFAVVGIGLNINQQDFELANATSIRALTGSQFDVEELFRLLVIQLEQGYIKLKKGKWNEIKTEYLMHLYRMGIWSDYSSDGQQFSGKIVGIDANGKLQIELKSGELLLFGLKEVAFL